MTTSQYSVAKDRNKWAIFKDGKAEGWERTKKAAQERMTGYQERDAYEARILAEDASQVYKWTESEDRQIQEYASQLRENPTKRTLTGEYPLDELGRKTHTQQANTIASWYAWGEPSEHGKVVCAELRRERTARELAYQLAGLSI